MGEGRREGLGPDNYLGVGLQHLVVEEREAAGRV